MSSHGGGGGERWLVSYSDFITLLMVLFVVLYSMGQTDIKRYKQLADGLKTAFSGGPTSIVDPGIDQAGGGDKSKASPIIIPGIPQHSVDSVEVAGELTDMLNATKLGGAVSVQNNIEGVLISLSEKLTFKPGTTDLQTDAFPVLDTIVKMVKPLQNEIRVVGYTDDTPPVDPKYQSNLELSLDRALVITNYFIKSGIDPKRITVSGRGEFKPLFPNDTPEHKALNSRAEIIIVYALATDVINSHPSMGTNPIAASPAPSSAGSSGGQP
jgi:chemotaxis protein MotB